MTHKVIAYNYLNGKMLSKFTDKSLTLNASKGETVTINAIPYTIEAFDEEVKGDTITTTLHLIPHNIL